MIHNKIVCIVLKFFILIGICYLIFSNNIQYLLNILILISFILVYLINFSSLKIVDEMIDVLDKKNEKNKVIMKFIFGCLLSLFLVNQGNIIAQRQVDITNRETAPELYLSIDQTQNSTSYRLSNKKGMASYINLTVCENYYFFYNGESYEFNLDFMSNEINGNSNLNNNCDELFFVIDDENFDREKVYQIIKEYLESIDQNIHVSNTRYIELSFYDYKNENKEFEYNEYNDEIRLMSTSGTKHYYENNIGNVWNKDRSLDDIIISSLKYLLEKQ